MKPGRFLNSILFGRRSLAILLLGAFFFLTTIVTPGPAPRLGDPALAGMTATPVAFDSDGNALGRVGPLVFLRGWNLDSDDVRFGGISAMQIVGRDVVALSDDGNLLRFPIPGSGPTQVRIVPLADGPGNRDSKLDRDTEAMWLEGDQAWIAYERHNMVWRYSAISWRADSSARPAAMRRWGRNSGTEAMARLRDGRFILFAEGGDSAFSAALLFDGDPAEGEQQAVALRYRRIPGYRVTDVAVLPGRPAADPESALRLDVGFHCEARGRGRARPRGSTM